MHIMYCCGEEGMHKNKHGIELQTNTRGENNFERFTLVFYGCDILSAFGLMNTSSKGGKLSFSLYI